MKTLLFLFADQLCTRSNRQLGGIGFGCWVNLWFCFWSLEHSRYSCNYCCKLRRLTGECVLARNSKRDHSCWAESTLCCAKVFFIQPMKEHRCAAEVCWNLVCCLLQRLWDSNINVYVWTHLVLHITRFSANATVPNTTAENVGLLDRLYTLTESFIWKTPQRLSSVWPVTYASESAECALCWWKAARSRYSTKCSWCFFTRCTLKTHLTRRSHCHEHKTGSLMV